MVREITERDKAQLTEGIPESYLALWCPGLQGLGTKLLDRSTNANHTTITGATWKRLPRGLYVLDFNGTTDLVNFGSPSYYDAITGNCTFEAWVNPDSLGGFEVGRIFDLSKIRLYVDSPSRAYFEVKVSAADIEVWSANNSLPFGTWRHVAGVFNSVNALIYVNTTLATGSTSAGPIDDHSADSLIIGNVAAATRGFDGKIALPRVYNCALSLTELTRHYNRERHLFGV